MKTNNLNSLLQTRLDDLLSEPQKDSQFFQNVPVVVENKPPVIFNRSQIVDSVISPYGGRVEPDVYHAENYRGFTLRYVHDPVWQGKIRVYVEDAPSYKGRDTSISVVHRWPEKDGAPPYICFKEEHAPSSYSEAKRHAEKWCDLTLRYIETGITISEQITQGD